MPERPDLDYQIPLLASEISDTSITGVTVLLPTVLRMMVVGDVRTLLQGARIAKVTRRAHFACFHLTGVPVDMAIHPMLAGRFTLASPESRRTKDTAMIFGLSDGRELRYRDDVEMGKVYVLPRGAWDRVPGLGQVGLDILDAAVFTRAAFGALARKRRDQVKVFLMDKSALDALGNAYADEVLWEARIHPKARVSELGAEDLDRLHAALVSVLQSASDEIRRRAPPLDEKLRDFLHVRGRKGAPCDRCGQPIRVAGVLGHDAYFCAVCQPDRSGRGFVDWRKGAASP